MTYGSLVWSLTTKKKHLINIHRYYTGIANRKFPINLKNVDINIIYNM